MTDGQPAAMGVRDVLRIRDFRNLFAGQVVSDIGDGITILLVLLVIHDLTGSATALALMAIAEAVPAFTVGLVAGVYVDRWNRRRIMLAADLLRAVIVLAFALVQSPELVPLLYVLGFTQASIATFFRPARGALLPHIVPVAGLPAANGLAQASQVIGGLIGAGLAGLIFATFGSGLAGFAIDSATFVVSFLFVLRISAEAGRIDASEAMASVRAGIGSSVQEGLRIVRRSRILAGLVLSVSVTMLGLGAVNVLFVPLIVEELRVSPSWMAGFDAAQVAGMLGASMVVALLARRLAPTAIITAGLVGIGIAIGALYGASQVWHVMLVLLVAGLCVTPLQAMVQTLVQTAAGDATRGRVVSIMQASMSTASVASMAIGGVLGDLIGIRSVFLAAGGFVLVAAAVSWVMFRGVSGRPEPATQAGPIAAGEAT
jgi:MFS transporter, DHA3 family, macrolide efflux protein